MFIYIYNYKTYVKKLTERKIKYKCFETYLSIRAKQMFNICYFYRRVNKNVN